MKCVNCCNVNCRCLNCTYSFEYIGGIWFCDHYSKPCVNVLHCEMFGINMGCSKADAPSKADTDTLNRYRDVLSMITAQQLLSLPENVKIGLRDMTDIRKKTILLEYVAENILKVRKERV